MIVKNNHIIPILKMTNFENFPLGDIQDPKNPGRSCGFTLLFANRKDASDTDYLKLLLKDIIQDIIVLITNGIKFNSESFNIIIVGKSSNPDEFHDFNPETQKIRLFFFDFSHKVDPFKIADRVNFFENNHINETLVN